MNVKTIKRTSKRTISVLLSVLMVLSLFTVCMLGTAVSAGAYDSLDGKTITLNASGWNTSAYIFVGKGSYTSVYKMDGSNGSFSKTFASGTGWSDATGYFFSTENYGLSDGGGKSENVSTVRNNLLAGKYTCSAFVDRNTNDIVSGNKYTVASNGTVTVTTGGTTTENVGWIDTTMYNYRTKNQIADAKANTTKSDYAIDSTNGQAKSNYDETVYKSYNQAVTDWYKAHYNGTDGKTVTDSSVDATPLFQGNFRAGNANTDANGTIEWARTSNSSLWHFVSVANGANRFNGADGTSTNAAAIGLVDKKLSVNGTIQQNGVELPQFSDAFMEANGDEKLQSKYSGLKFQTKTKQSGTDDKNTWYYYDSSNDGNRYLDVSTNQILAGSNIHGCDPSGNNSSNGYYPFHKTQPSNNDNITNCYGTRFDIEFAMTASGTINGEQLQFKFTGDDDLWVFIDGYLALDLGGSHNKASGNINLATKQSQITSGSYPATYADVTNKYSSGKSFTSSTTTTNFSAELSESLKDTSKPHTMTIFYLERGLYDSNLSFEFLLPQTNSLKIVEEVDASDVNPGLKTKTLETANNDVFNVNVKTDSKSADENVVAGSSSDFVRTSVSGDKDILQKGTNNPTPAQKFENQTGGMSGVGGTNFLWEDDNTTGKVTTGRGTATSNSDVQLLYNQSGTFNDQFEVGKTIQLLQKDNIDKFDLPNLTSNQPTSSDSERKVGDYYSTTTKIVDTSGATINPESNGAFSFENTDGSTNTVKVTATYTNKIKVGDIAFTKSTDDGTMANNAYFNYKLEVANVFGGNTAWYVPEGLVYSINGIKVEAGLGSEGLIQLQVGDEVTVEGIPVGTKYRIVETGSDANGAGYSVADVINDGYGTVADEQAITDGITATVSASDTTTSVVWNFVNSMKTFTVLYRFQDRDSTTGLPTTCEDHYTYFTREMTGDINSYIDAESGAATDDLKHIVSLKAPEISNVLCDYSVSANGVEYRELTNIDLNTKLAQPTDDSQLPVAINGTSEAEGTDGLTVGESVVIVTYSINRAKYTASFTFPQDGVMAEKTVTGHFNDLVRIPYGIEAPKEYNGGEFRYWAKLVDIDGGDSSNKVWTPVSTDYVYAYRITDDVEIKAVYSNDPEFVQLEAPTVTDDKSYHVTGEGTGYDASAAEKIYDSYTKGDKDYTRVNVVFGSVGSQDNDTDISSIGYILIKNTGDYVKAANFNEELLKNTLNAGSSTVKDTSGKSYSALIKTYDNLNFVPSYDSEYDYEATKWKDNYTAGKYNLTNKNRVNFVFDLLNNENTQKNYFTCYTVMTRGNETYISNTPAYFNLAEADPAIRDTDDDTTDYYSIVASQKYKVNNGAAVTGTKAGTLSTGGYRSIADGQKVTFTYNPTSYTENGTNYISELESLVIGIGSENSITIDSSNFNLFGIDPSAKGSVSYTFNAEFLFGSNPNPSTDKLQAVATFKVTENSTSVNVQGKTFENGKYQVSASANGTYSDALTVDYSEGATSFYVKAIANSGYNFTNWTVNGTENTDNPIKVDVADNGSMSINGTVITMDTLVANFAVQTYSVRVSSNDGTYGTVSAKVNGVEQTGGIFTVNAGDQVVVTATPTGNATFNKWTVTGSTGTASGNTYTVTVNKNTTIQADFNAPVTDITIYVADISGVGSIYSRNSLAANWSAATLYGTYTKNGTTANLYKLTVKSNISWMNISKNTSGENQWSPSLGSNLYDGAVFEYNANNSNGTYSKFADWTVSTKRTVKVHVDSTAVNWVKNDSAVIRMTYTDYTGNKKTVNMDWYNNGALEAYVEVSDFGNNNNVSFARVNNTGTGTASNEQSFNLANCELASGVYQITITNYTYN